MNPEMKESFPNISIEIYNESDKSGLITALSDLQEFERRITDTLRPGPEISEDYFKELQNNILEKSGIIFVAKDNNGKFVGFISCLIEERNDVLHTAESNKYGYIADAYVIPSLRGKGIFSQLSRKAEEYIYKFEDIKFIRMHVNAENVQALNAYKHLGYVPESIKLIKKIERK